MPDGFQILAPTPRLLVELVDIGQPGASRQLAKLEGRNGRRA